MKKRFLVHMMVTTHKEEESFFPSCPNVDFSHFETRGINDMSNCFKKRKVVLTLEKAIPVASLSPSALVLDPLGVRLALKAQWFFVLSQSLKGIDLHSNTPKMLPQSLINIVI